MPPPTPAPTSAADPAARAASGLLAPHGIAAVLQASGRGLRRNFLPGVVLWLVGMSLVLAYYQLPAARPLFERIAQWKASGGFAFSAVSSSLFGGVIPFLALLALDRIPRGRGRGIALFLIGFWALRGMEIDGLYRLQGLLFGTGTDAWTVVKKVAVDQLVYSVAWSAPFSLLAYRWKDAGFNARVLRAVTQRSFWLGEIPVVVVSLWGVWIPAVAIIYSLPADLQIPLFNIVLCFWVLLLETLARRGEPAGAQASSSPADAGPAGAGSGLRR
jgi:hypothetical protein